MSRDRRHLLGQMVVFSVLIAWPAMAAEYEGSATGEGQEMPTKYHSQPEDISTVAFSPSLYFDSALAVSGGAAVVIKLAGGCAHVCSGVFALVEGEVGLFGYQARNSFVMSGSTSPECPLRLRI
jgi:hypothetical protein